MLVKNLTFTVSEKLDATPGIEIDYFISALDGEELVGYLRLEERKDVDMAQWFGGKEEVIPRILYLAFVSTLDEYQQQGIGTQLYKEFAKLYKEKYNGRKVAHMFTNPIAEYMFRKAVANGDIPIEAYNEEYFFYDAVEDEHGAIWEKLNQKLPDQFKGSMETWTCD